MGHRGAIRRLAMEDNIKTTVEDES